MNPHPPHTAPDDALFAAVQARPYLLETVCGEASRADAAIRNSRIGRADLGISTVWQEAQRQIGSWQHRRGSMNNAEAREAAVAQLRLALQARDVLAPVAVDLSRLSDMDVAAIVGTQGSVGFPEAKRAAMERHPGLAACLARVDARSAETDTLQRAVMDRAMTDRASGARPSGGSGHGCLWRAWQARASR